MFNVTHKDVQGQLDALFVGDPEPSILVARDHLKTCPECQNYFEALVEADAWGGSAFENDEAEQSFERRYSLAVMQAVDFQVDKLQPAPSEEGSLTARLAHWWRQTFWAPIAATAAVFLVMATLPALWNAVESDIFEPRGAAELQAERIQRVELFCVEVVGERVQFHEAPKGKALECGVNEELKFGVINAPRSAQSDAGSWNYITLVGQSPETPEQLHWYQPERSVSSDSSSITIGTHARLKPFGETIRLSVNHRPSSLQVMAIFSDRPIDRERLSKALRDTSERRSQMVETVLSSQTNGRYAMSEHMLVVHPANYRATQP